MMRKPVPDGTYAVARAMREWAGLYGGPFYAGGTHEERAARRKAVLLYVPHAFREATRMPHVCRICGFPRADAPCVQ